MTTTPIDESENLLCVQCSYNLRGLDSAGSCPECGLVIAETLSSRQLRRRDRDALEKLHSALLFLTVGSTLGLAYFVYRVVYAHPIPLLYVAANAPTILGLLMISAPGVQVETSLERSVRRIVRAYGIACIIYCAQLLLGMSYIHLLGVNGALAISAVYFLFPFAGQMALMFYLKLIAEQLPSAKLARFALQQACLTAAVLAIAIVARTLDTIQIHRQWQNFRQTQPPPPRWLLPTVNWSWVVVGAASILLLHSVYRRVDELLKQSSLSNPNDQPP